MYIYLIKLRAIAGIIPLTLDVHITKASASTWSTLPCSLLKSWFSHSHYPCFQISSEKFRWKALLWKVKLPTTSQVFWNERSIIMNISVSSQAMFLVLSRERTNSHNMKHVWDIVCVLTLQSIQLSVRMRFSLQMFLQVFWLEYDLKECKELTKKGYQ